MSRRRWVKLELRPNAETVDDGLRLRPRIYGFVSSDPNFELDSDSVKPKSNKRFFFFFYYYLEVCYWYK